MTTYDITRKSRPIIVTEYQPGWVQEFAETAREIRRIVDSGALRIDHIGSTSVPGLGAKDVIDIQVTVAALDHCDDFINPLADAGFRVPNKWRYDDFYGMPETDQELRKFFFREPEGRRRTHIHVREAGRFNQRYALLFRDYLRNSKVSRQSYEVLKQRAAELFPESIGGYLYLKEPVLHIIFQAASLWGESVHWEPDQDFV